MERFHILILDEVISRTFIGFTHYERDISSLKTLNRLNQSGDDVDILQEDSDITERGETSLFKEKNNRPIRKNLPRRNRYTGNKRIIPSKNGEAAPISIGKWPVLSDLPIWSNFRIRDILNISIIGSVPFTIFPLNEKDVVKRLLNLLNKQEICENIIIGRTGNITILNWRTLASRLRGLQGTVKIHVGKVPSDLYAMKKKDLVNVLHKWEDGLCDNLASWLFDKFFFYNFERIIDISGFSFLLRNSFEYYRENLKIMNYLKLKNFIEIYRKLMVSSLSNITISESGVITNSLLGGGVRVEGVVKNSVIFNGVNIGKRSMVNNSVILPLNRIEEGVIIENSLILKGNGRVIGGGSIIGREIDIENKDYYHILKRGLTIISEGISIPQYSRIGAGCLVTDFGGPIDAPITLDDGKVLRI